MNYLPPTTIKSNIKSPKIRKILIHLKQIWVIPNKGYSVTEIIDDTYNTLTNLYPGQIIKKEGSNRTIINISRTKNGRISISADGKTQFSYIYFKDPVEKSTIEDRQVNKLDNIISKLYNSATIKPIKFKIGNKPYTISNYNQNTVKQVGSSGDKTDVIISTDTGNVYISLKGNTYQQWGGVSNFPDDVSVVTFIDKLKQIKQKNPDNKKEYYMNIINDELIKKSMYGKNFNINGPGSIDNVDHILVGEQIIISGNIITATHTYDRGSICTPRPTILSRNTGAGDKNRSDFGIKNTRILIWSGRRNNSEEIK